jgi:hypothetical protein
MEYGIAAWATWAKLHILVDRVKHSKSSRAYYDWSHEIHSYQKEEITKLQPIEDRKETKILIQSAKIKRLEDHPFNDRMKSGTKNRLSRSSFVHQAKQLERKCKTYEQKATPLPTHAFHLAWKRKTLPLIIPRIPGIEKTKRVKRGTKKTASRKACSFVHQAKQLERKCKTYEQKATPLPTHASHLCLEKKDFTLNYFTYTRGRKKRMKRGTKNRLKKSMQLCLKSETA